MKSKEHKHQVASIAVCYAPWMKTDRIVTMGHHT